MFLFQPDIELRHVVRQRMEGGGRGGRVRTWSNGDGATECAPRHPRHWAPVFCRGAEANSRKPGAAATLALLRQWSLAMAKHPMGLVGRFEIGAVFI